MARKPARPPAVKPKPKKTAPLKKAAPPRVEIADLVIAGAGPAGCAAAITAARAGAVVKLIDKCKFPRARMCGGWLGPAGVKLAEGLGVGREAAGAVEFRGLTLARFDLKSQTPVNDPGLHGWIVERGRFDTRLIEAAKAAGVDVRLNTAIGGLRCAEDAVELTCDAKVVRGRLVLIADGPDSPLAVQAGLQPPAQLDSVTQLAFATFASSAPPGLLLGLGAQRAGLIATIVTDGKAGRLTVSTREAGAGLAARAEEFVRHARAAKLMPENSPALRTARCPAGLALELDSHVGKRTLLIGDAGGFVAAFSNEGLYPAMRSGQVAAEAALRALQARVPQDELAGFESDWRTALADYLRMPNTDLSLLAPLVFSNAEMSRRVARAFLLGVHF